MEGGEQLADAIGQAIGPASDDVGVPGHDEAQQLSRQSQAVIYRLSGLTYDQIAERVGYSDRSGARQAVLRALAAVRDDSVSELRDLENARLERANQAIWPAVISGDVAALRAWLRLAERRARLNGLDSPTQVAISTGTKAELEAAFGALREAALEYERARDEWREDV